MMNSARHIRTIALIAFAYGIIARSIASYIAFYGTVGLAHFCKDLGYTVKGLVTLDAHLLVESLGQLFWS